MISEGGVSQRVQLAGVNVGFELSIPLGGVEGGEPFPELSQLLGCEAADLALKLFDLCHT